MTTISWETYVAQGEALNARFADVAPMPDGASTGDYWTPVPGQDDLYFRNIEWGSIWSDDRQVVACVVAEQYSDGRPPERSISMDFDDTDGNERMIQISFETARKLSAILAKFDESAAVRFETAGSDR